MEPHSRPCVAHHGTLRLPLALVLLLKTALAGPTSDRVAQTVNDLALWHNINKSAHRLIHLISPFSSSANWTTSIFVGMVKLTALCGIGSVLWIWGNRTKTRKTPNSQHASNAAEGMIFPARSAEVLLL